jgi:hypothetical protein
MRREIPAVRILPMSDSQKGFVGRSIDQVQANIFLKYLPAHEGRYRYRSTGLNAEPGTVVLFQFKARIIASAVFLRDEKFEKPKGGHSGEIHFDAKSFRTFDPLDVEAMRKAWPSFRAFGHVKQFLNPTRYSIFNRRLKNVKSAGGE